MAPDNSTSRPAPLPPHHAPGVTPYDRLVWSDTQVEHWLVNDEHKRELVVWFGHDSWVELTALAKQAQAARARAGGAARPLAWIVPGIMGTQLGRARPPGAEAPDVLWLDPIDVIQGRLPELRVHDTDGIRTFGVLLHSHLRLKLRLVMAGFDVRFFEYDWRRALPDTGAAFAAALRADPRPGVIVAHSMGGLVARVALAREPAPWLTRIVLLGTPNHGAYAAAQALRGTYAVVRRLAMLDARRSAEELAASVFATLPALHDLLPFGEFAGGLDLRDATHWPAAGPGPDRALLERARRLPAALAPADARFACIAGIGERTVTHARCSGDGFAWRYGLDGDGTVALRSAVLPGAPTWIARCGHSPLTRDPDVARAVIDLVGGSDPGGLRPLVDPAGADLPDPEPLEFSDEELRATLTGKLDWAALEADERRRFLEALNEPVLPRDPRRSSTAPA